MRMNGKIKLKDKDINSIFIYLGKNWRMNSGIRIQIQYLHISNQILYSLSHSFWTSPCCQLSFHSIAGEKICVFVKISSGVWPHWLNLNEGCSFLLLSISSLSPFLLSFSSRLERCPSSCFSFSCQAFSMVSLKGSPSQIDAEPIWALPK